MCSEFKPAQERQRTPYTYDLVSRNGNHFSTALALACGPVRRHRPQRAGEYGKHGREPAGLFSGPVRRRDGPRVREHADARRRRRVDARRRCPWQGVASGNITPQYNIETTAGRGAALNRPRTGPSKAKRSSLASPSKPTAPASTGSGRNATSAPPSQLATSRRLSSSRTAGASGGTWSSTSRAVTACSDCASRRLGQRRRIERVACDHEVEGTFRAHQCFDSGDVKIARDDEVERSSKRRRAPSLRRVRRTSAREGREPVPSELQLRMVTPPPRRAFESRSSAEIAATPAGQTTEPTGSFVQCASCHGFCQTKLSAVASR